MNANIIPIRLKPVGVKSRGRFRAVVHTGHEYDKFGNITRHGIILRETPFGNNKVTTTGFDKILQNQGGSLCMVCGSGNSAPAEGNSLLDSYLGKTQTFATSSTTRNVVPDGSGDVWWRMTKRCTFGPGSLGGGSVNVAEAAIVTNVSFGSINSATPINARGLLVDGVGNPATVSVNNATEYLDIIWEYTEWVASSVTGVVSLTIDGVATNFDYEVRPYYFDNTGGSYNYSAWANAGSNSWPGYSPIGDGTYTWSHASNVFAGPITAITGHNLGNGTRANIPIMSSDAYVAGSKQRTINMTWLPVNANIAGGIGVVRVNLGHSGWQVSFDPKIAKVSTKQLDLSFTLSMANR